MKEFQKHTLNLRPGDWDYLTAILAPHSIPTSVFVRNLIARQVDALRSQESNKEIDLKVKLPLSPESS